MLGELFEGRVLPFDEPAAVEYARLASSRIRIGRTVGPADTQIAAIAVSAGAHAMATRSTRDFTDVGLPLVDPWI